MLNDLAGSVDHGGQAPRGDGSAQQPPLGGEFGTTTAAAGALNHASPTGAAAAALTTAVDRGVGSSKCVSVAAAAAGHLHVDQRGQHEGLQGVRQTACNTTTAAAVVAVATVAARGRITVG